MSVTYNLPDGQKAERKLEMIFVNCGTSDKPDWEIQGRGVEDASLEFNHDTEQVTDILGITDTNVAESKPSIEMDPNNIRGGQKLSAKLLDIERRHAIAEFGTFEVLCVHAFAGEPSFLAEKHVNCTVVPTSLGGSDYVGMPITIYLSNDSTTGTATVASGVPTFTADTAS